MTCRSIRNRFQLSVKKIFQGIPITFSSKSFIFFITGSSGNKNNNNAPPSQTTSGCYQHIDLVTDGAGSNAAIIDKNLVNAWGIAANPKGIGFGPFHIQNIENKL
jgi:hypothetical protein